MILQELNKVEKLLKTKNIKLICREPSYWSCYKSGISFQDFYANPKKIGFGVVKIDYKVVKSFKDLKKYVEKL